MFSCKGSVGMQYHLLVSLKHRYAMSTILFKPQNIHSKLNYFPCFYKCKTGDGLNTLLKVLHMLVKYVHSFDSGTSILASLLPPDYK